MKTVIELLTANPKVSDYKIHIHNKESYELFFVKGALETVRCTDTCDKEVTVYVDHDEFKGDAQFFVYPSTTAAQMDELIEEAISKALLIRNRYYALPEKEEGTYTVPSNFSDFAPADLAAQIARTVFAANTVENASLNAVEVFINKHTEQVINSRGLNKSQVRYDAMVEAIPTYNGQQQSVELYEQHNFAAFDEAVLAAEIAGKMAEVKARYEAITPAQPVECPVVLNIQETAQLMQNIARDLNYSTVYSHSNLFQKGDTIQKAPEGDLIGITMLGQVPGSVRSTCFDADGLSLNSARIVEGGRAVNYYGSNRFGQYLEEVPTGSLPCLQADPGTAELPSRYLDVLSMSGLQVDFYNDYIGGEVRLAYLVENETVTPVTGISISGKVSEVLNHIRLSSDLGIHNGYYGPAQAVLSNMKIF